MAAAETARLIAELSLKDGLTSGVNKALGSVSRLDKGLGRVGKGAVQVGRGVGSAAVKLGAVVAVGFGAAAKAAIDYQDAFQGVVKTVDEADLNRAGLTFEGLSDSLRKMSREMPNTAVELANIAAGAGALGVKGKDIEAFTKQVAILASTTNLSADEAATGLGQLQNIIGLTGDEFDNFTASLVDLGNKGESTEAQILEIARRAGGAAKLFGIAKNETLGWSAAAANLGLNEELAGTALQNLFIKAMPKFSAGSKDLQKVMGLTGQQLKTLFKKDAGGAIEGLIKKIGSLPKDARLAAVQKLFGKGSGLTRLVLGLAESVDKNLDPALRDSAKAWQEATAAQAEFDKRNSTVKSAFARLKNNILDAAVTIGEGFVPALGRAADKISAFLSLDGNREKLRDLGKQIGDVIDGLDFDRLLKSAQGAAGALKPMLEILLGLVNALSALPDEVKGAGAALLVANKLSGGAISSGIGNIFGGLGESLAKSLASKIPLFGSAFVQPVFVTNMGVGGVGGGGVPLVPGGGKPASLGGKLLNGASKLLLVGFVAEMAQQLSPVITGFGVEIHKQLQLPDFKLPVPDEWPWGPKNTPTILPDLFGGNGLLGGTPGSKSPASPNPDAHDENKKKFDQVKTAIDLAKTDTVSEQIATRNAAAADAARGITVNSLGFTVSAAKAQGTTYAARDAGYRTASAMAAAATSIVAAVSALDLSVNVTTVNRTSTINNRYGPSGGSRNTDRLNSGHGV